MIRKLVFAASRLLRHAARLLEKAVGAQEIAVQRTMIFHDMVLHPDEAYYQEQYWNWMLPELEQRFSDRRARALDVGCGQGRLAVPLAEWLSSGTVVGIDLTGPAIESARAYARERTVTNVEFQEVDARKYVNALAPASLDLALMLEVAFFMPSYREVIDSLANALKPGGLLLISFRSQHFDLLHSIRSRDWQSARLVRDVREGNWGGGSTWFSWQTTDDITQILSAAGFALERICGIGVCSGIEGDPLSLIAQPSQLSERDRAELMEIELSFAEQYPNCGRYVLAVASKRAG